MYDYRQDAITPIRVADDEPDTTPVLLRPVPLSIWLSALIVAFCRVAVALGW